MFFVIMILIIALVVLIATTFVQEASACLTPYGENGICKLFSDCEVVVSALNTAEEHALRFYHDSHCGCDGGKVCCGTKNTKPYPKLINCAPVPRECLTPYGESGTCKVFSECEAVVSALNAGGQESVRFYQDSQCGCDRGKVCCGTLNTKPFPQLINCKPASPTKLVLSIISDNSICGLDSSTDKILGGDLANAEEYPWLVALEYKSKRTEKSVGIRCGGSLIAPRFVLTAAHCILHKEFVIIKVWLGVNNITSEETCFTDNGHLTCAKSVKKLNVKRAITHESYSSLPKFHDIGLLELESAVQFTDYIRPLCLPKWDSETPSSGTYFTVAGWGATEIGETSEVKRKVKVPLTDNNICEEYLKRRNRNITSQQLCVGGEIGKDSCEGDSGGPLMQEFVGANGDTQWFQQGIVSYGFGCGGKGKPSVYTKVAVYDFWLRDKMSTYLGEGEPCKTQNGICVVLNTCPELFKRIFARSEFYNFASINQCDALNTLVCCKNPGSIISNAASVFPDKTKCGILKEEPGLKDDEVHFPWIVGIEVSTGQGRNTEIRCIGTIIHSRYVVSSDKCVFEESTSDTYEPINVWLGPWSSSTRNNTNPVQKIGIKKIIPYPIYSHDNVLTLILLEEPIQFSDSISPICLDSPNLPKPEVGKSITVLRLPYSTEAKPITSSDTIKQELPLSACFDEVRGCQAGNIADGCENTVLYAYGTPVMRKYEDTASGRMQWYLVDVYDPPYPTYNCYQITYNNKIIEFLDWIITIISEYS